jgi:hypothetical protein
MAWSRWALPSSSGAEFALKIRGLFFHFRAISGTFGQFRPVFRPDFSVFVFFRIFSDGIHAPRRGPCTIGHPRIVLRQDVRPHPLSKIHFGNTGEFRLHTFCPHFTLHGHDMLHFLGAAVGLGLIFGLEVATQVMAQDAPRLEARPADTDAPEVPGRL